MIVYKFYFSTTIVIYFCLFQVLQDTRGSRGRMPNTIHKALCSQACHGNIFIEKKVSLFYSVLEIDRPFSFIDRT